MTFPGYQDEIGDLFYFSSFVELRSFLIKFGKNCKKKSLSEGVFVCRVSYESVLQILGIHEGSQRSFAKSLWR
jgi:hypothetical protein